MTVPTNTYVSYATEGIKEDVIDVITNISPLDTWFTSNTGSTRAIQSYHEWQTDDLAAAASNAQIEGDDADASAATATTKTGNYTQILRKVFQIADSNEMMDSYGRDSEVNYQKAKHMKELAKDIEYALIVNTASCVGSSGAARTPKGLDGWTSDNCVYGGASFGASPTLSEPILNDALQEIWADGGKPQHVLCGAHQKRQIDGFSTNTRDIAAEARTLVGAVDVFKSSFGVLQIRLHHQINTSLDETVFILGDMDLWKKAWLRPPKTTELAKTGDSRKFMMVTEVTLESRQEKGSGKIDGLATS